MFPSVAARLRALATLLFLASCGSEPPTVVLDLLSVLPAAEKRTEPGRIDFGGLSEQVARLEGFSEPSRSADGTTFRRVGSTTAKLGVWLLRPSAWTVLLRYRTSAAHLPGRIQSGGQRVMELPPTENWTETRGVLEPSATPGSETTLELVAPNEAGLELDWLELRPLGRHPAQPRPVDPSQLGPVQPVASLWTFYASIPSDASGIELRYSLRADDAPLRLSVVADGESWDKATEVSHELTPGAELRDHTLALPGSGFCRIRVTVTPTGPDDSGAIRWSRIQLVARTGGAASLSAGTTSDEVTNSTPRQPMPPPRDIFLFILDAARADHFGAYGYARGATPWIDALSRQGVVFSNARAPAPYTQSSTATLMTSLEPETHDVRAVQSRLSERAVTLAEVLSGAGYATSAHIGCANADRPFGFAQGFEFFAGGRHERTLARVEELLQSRAHSFFYVHLFPPHHPYQPPAPFEGIYSAFTTGSVRGSSEELLRIRRSGSQLPPTELAHLIAQYDETLLYGDHLLGEILSTADRLGHLDESLVIVLADHGEAFQEHGSVLHGYAVHDEELRIPMIVRAPRAAGIPSRVVADVVGTVDILPTILELAGVSDPAPLRHGHSLVPLMLGGTRPGAEMYARAQGAQLTASLAGSQWKMQVAETESQLFDLLRDPGELHDLSAERPYLAGWLRQKTLERHVRNLVDGQEAGLREEAVLDEQTIRELRSLGYIE